MDWWYNKLFENYSIWIDYNHDNDFTDAGEQVVNISSNLGGYIAVNFTVPANAVPGPTRMRVTMQYGGAPSPCGVYPRGETEDYTVVISGPSSSRSNLLTTNEVIREIDALEIFPNPVSDILYIKSISNDKRSNQFIEIYDMAGRKLWVNNISGNRVNVSALKTGSYFIRVTQNSVSIYSGRFIKK